MKKTNLVLGMLLIMLLAMNVNVFADGTQPVGSGTEADPYQVATLDNLLWISTNSSSWDKYFEQTADIDASSTNTWNSGAGFSPIGNDTTQFTGSYDGQDHTISGLYINRSSTAYLGLFGYASSGATIQDLGLTNASITVSSPPSFTYIGTIAGRNYGTISGSYATGSVTGGNHYNGGIAGRNVGTINNSYSEAAVSGSNYTGGITGQHSSGTISGSYSTGTVTCGNLAGGITGCMSSGSISNCYSRSAVVGSYRAGGAIGYIYGATSTVNNIYSVGAISGSSSIGGLVGDYSDGTINNSFWDTETSGQSSSASGTGKTTAQMKTQSTFTDAGWDFTTPIWKIDGSINDGYPYLNWQFASAPTVSTQAVSNILTTTATGNGNITNLGNPNPTAHGVCWNTLGTPTIAGSHTDEGVALATGAFTTSMTGLLADTTYYVRAYATNEADTAYGNEVSFKTSEDGTGVPPDVQDAGPNGGDGNGDGIKDSKQTTVASLPSATGGGYITVATDCDQIEQVETHTYEYVGISDPGYSYPFGLVGFVIPCPSATVRIYYHGAGSLAGFTYRKYGPTPADWGTSLWYTMPGATFGTEEIGGETVPYAEFDLTESELGDDTEGSPIIDQGGPAQQGGPTAVPTLNEWGMIILSLLMAVCAFIVIRRRQQA